MIQKIKYWYIRLELEEELDYIYEIIDSIEDDIEDYAKKSLNAKHLKSELSAYKNLERRILKIKEKYK